MSRSDTDSITVQYTASDFRSLYRICRKCRRNLLFILCVPVAIGIGLPLLWGEAISLLDVLLQLVVVGLVLSLFLWILPAYQVRSRRRLGWAPPLEIRLDEEKVMTRHPKASSDFFWTGIDHVAATPERLYIFTTSACAIILPRHAFPSVSAFDEWGERAALYWAEARKRSQ